MSLNKKYASANYWKLRNWLQSLIIIIIIILMSDSNLLAHHFQNRIKEQKQINGKTTHSIIPLKSGEIRGGFLSSGFEQKTKQQALWWKFCDQVKLCRRKTRNSQKSRSRRVSWSLIKEMSEAQSTQKLGSDVSVGVSPLTESKASRFHLCFRCHKSLTEYKTIQRRH